MTSDHNTAELNRHPIRSVMVVTMEVANTGQDLASCVRIAAMNASASCRMRALSSSYSCESRLVACSSIHNC